MPPLPSFVELVASLGLEDDAGDGRKWPNGPRGAPTATSSLRSTGGSSGNGDGDLQRQSFVSRPSESYTRQDSAGSTSTHSGYSDRRLSPPSPAVGRSPSASLSASRRFSPYASFRDSTGDARSRGNLPLGSYILPPPVQRSPLAEHTSWIRESRRRSDSLPMTLEPSTIGSESTPSEASNSRLSSEMTTPISATSLLFHHVQESGPPSSASALSPNAGTFGDKLPPIFGKGSTNHLGATTWPVPTASRVHDSTRERLGGLESRASDPALRQRFVSQSAGSTLKEGARSALGSEVVPPSSVRRELPGKRRQLAPRRNLSINVVNHDDELSPENSPIVSRPVPQSAPSGTTRHNLRVRSHSNLLHHTYQPILISSALRESFSASRSPSQSSHSQSQSQPHSPVSRSPLPHSFASSGALRAPLSASVTESSFAAAAAATRRSASARIPLHHSVSISSLSSGGSSQKFAKRRSSGSKTPYARDPQHRLGASPRSALPSLPASPISPITIPTLPALSSAGAHPGSVPSRPHGSRIEVPLAIAGAIRKRKSQEENDGQDVDVPSAAGDRRARSRSLLSTTASSVPQTASPFSSRFATTTASLPGGERNLPANHQKVRHYHSSVSLRSAPAHRRTSSSSSRLGAGTQTYGIVMPTLPMGSSGAAPSSKVSTANASSAAAASSGARRRQQASPAPGPAPTPTNTRSTSGSTAESIVRSWSLHEPARPFVSSPGTTVAAVAASSSSSSSTTTTTTTKRTAAAEDHEMEVDVKIDSIRTPQSTADTDVDELDPDQYEYSRAKDEIIVD